MGFVYKRDLMVIIASWLLKECVRKHVFSSITKRTILKKHKKSLTNSKEKYHPIQSKDLEAFEKGLFNIASSLKSTRVYNEFQLKMKENISDIKSSPHVFIFAEKTNNIYIKHKNIKNCCLTM